MHREVNCCNPGSVSQMDRSDSLTVSVDERVDRCMC